MNRLTTCAAGLVLALAACSGDKGIEPPLTNLPRELSVAETQLIAADNSFAFDLLHQVLARDSATNVFISPLSVSVALGMTLNGTAGATADEMRSGLGYGGLSQTDVNAGYRGLIDLLAGLDSRVAWKLTNSVWYKQEYAFNPAFFDTTRAYFDALVSPLDFTSPDAGPTINQWVSDQTSGRITSIVPNVLPADARMYLINAIYFKGDWTTQFDPARTHQGTFAAPSGDVTVPMMSQDDMPIRMGQVDGRTIGELPYARGAFVMDIVLPRSGELVDSLAARATPADWAAWVAGIESTKMHVSLPKFTVVFERKLNDDLWALGMHHMFMCDMGADFTPMDPSNRVCVFEVKHKTFVKVDEAGTEAAAVTSVGVGVTSAPPAFAVNRPFLFAIRERLSGTIIFLGVIRNPAVN